MSRGRHRQASPLRRALPSLACMVLALAGLVAAMLTSSLGVLRVLVISVSVGACAAAFLLRQREQAAEQELAAEQSMRGRDEARFEERVAELEYQAEAAEEQVKRLERRVLAQRSQLAHAEATHGQLLRERARLAAEQALREAEAVQAREAAKRGSRPTTTAYLKAASALRTLERRAESSHTLSLRQPTRAELTPARADGELAAESAPAAPSAAVQNLHSDAKPPAAPVADSDPAPTTGQPVGGAAGSGAAAPAAAGQAFGSGGAVVGGPAAPAADRPGQVSGAAVQAPAAQGVAGGIAATAGQAGGGAAGSGVAVARSGQTMGEAAQGAGGYFDTAAGQNVGGAAGSGAAAPAVAGEAAESVGGASASGAVDRRAAAGSGVEGRDGRTRGRDSRPSGGTAGHGHAAPGAGGRQGGAQRGLVAPYMAGQAVAAGVQPSAATAPAWARAALPPMRPAAAVPPTALPRQGRATGTFNFFARQESAIGSKLGNDPADVIGDEAAAAQARYVAAPEAPSVLPTNAHERTEHAIVDLTAEDETEPIDVRAIRAV
ncbi:hypothetical protein ABIA32_004889 [Streptacidiphilus sp. MAP12-20]|uniref:hypothetical protein n=1 Tax=Streptacidiphilus sp. MAP12-20 TaxID=3156299 RepID=UPI0035163F50